MYFKIFINIMDMIKSFIERYKKTKEEFSQFVKDQNIQGKSEAAVASLQEKEQKLLAKELGVIHESLADCLSLKIKKNSLMLSKSIEEYSLTLSELFSSGYSTNYDLELQKFSKGTDDISFGTSYVTMDERKYPGHLIMQFKELAFL